MVWYVVTTSIMALVGLLVYLYYWKKGQFEEQEEVKYQLFQEDETNE